MGFIMLDTEKKSLIIERDYLMFQETILSEQYDEVTDELSEYLSEDGAQEDAYSKYLANEQQKYDSKKATIETKLKKINGDIDGLEKAVDTNVKQNKLNISV